MKSCERKRVKNFLAELIKVFMLTSSSLIPAKTQPKNHPKNHPSKKHLEVIIVQKKLKILRPNSYKVN